MNLKSTTIFVGVLVVAAGCNSPLSDACDGGVFPDNEIGSTTAVVLDSRFTSDERDAVIEGIEMWGITVSSAALIDADEPVVPGAINVARCDSIRGNKRLRGVNYEGTSVIGARPDSDLASLVAHETGHALGHTWHSENEKDLMFWAPPYGAYPSEEEISKFGFR